ncbi:MAG: methionyl-tRNA formyltransferase [Sphingomonadales bacterium]|nr:methionyl-tRNA formyltransferase [Sphingomonadales bacterium]
MRIIFMGTPDFAVPALQALAGAGHAIVAVYTQPPRPGGRRGKELTPTPVHRAAEALGAPVFHPASLKGAEEQAAFAALGSDIAIVAAYGLILPQAVLDAPKRGCLNLHASLLPRWRGAAPVQRAILAGDAETGIDVMRMEAGLDTGPVLAEARTAIGAHDTTGVLTQRLALLGAELIVTVLGDLDAYAEVPQPADGVTYAKKIDKTESRIDFSAGYEQVLRQVRAFNPAPGAWFELEGERYKVLVAEPLVAGPDDCRQSFATEPGVVIGDQLAIGCGDGAIRPTVIQRAGRPPMDVLELLRGRPIPAGTRLA